MRGEHERRRICLRKWIDGLSAPFFAGFLPAWFRQPFEPLQQQVRPTCRRDAVLDPLRDRVADPVAKGGLSFPERFAPSFQLWSGLLHGVVPTTKIESLSLRPASGSDLARLADMNRLLTHQRRSGRRHTQDRSQNQLYISRRTQLLSLSRTICRPKQSSGSPKAC
jgi:hypothetical protein